MFNMPNEKSEPLMKVIGVQAQLTEDEKSRMIAETREKELRDQMSRERGAERRGERRGELRGERRGVEKVAFNLLNTGMSIEEVAKLTMLDKSDIEKLKDSPPDAFAE